MIFLTSLEEIKTSVVGQKEWSNFGSKVGDPFLTIFSKDIKDALSQIDYEVGKSYNFSDNEFEYKVEVEDQLGEPKYVFFIKPKHVVENISTKLNFTTTQNYYLYIAILIVIFGFIILSGPIFKVLFG